MRRYHRWITSVAALFMAYLATTALIMQWDALRALLHPTAENAAEIAAMREGPAGPQNFTNMPAPSAFATALPKGDLRPLLARALTELRRAEPMRVISAVELRMISGHPQALFSFADQPRELAFDLESGARLQQPYFPGHVPGAGAFPDPNASFYGRVKSLHEFTFLGSHSVWLDLLLGLCLLATSITGIVIYFTMLARRRAGGRRGWFWK